MSHLQLRWLASVLLLAGLCCNMYAVDGIVLIDQNRALAGGVTPGDTPGFPVTISLAGSYRLSGNLTVPNASTTAISITADNVTIDLNGFSIIGPTVCAHSPITGGPVTSCSPTGSGVGVTNFDHDNTTVLNGSVRGMGSSGISLGGGGNGSYVEKVHATSNGGFAIIVRGGTVTNCTANFNSSGIAIINGGAGAVFYSLTASGNTASGNQFEGIAVDPGATVSGNTANNNGGFGFQVSCPSNVVGNTAVNNKNTNLVTFGAGCTVANNTTP